jgi:hypothetical protein
LYGCIFLTKIFKKEIQMKHIEVAITQLDKQEIPRGSNWGEDVQGYLKSVGITFPASWCMAFVYWCVEKSNGRIPDMAGGKSNPLVRTGGVMRQWNEIDTRAKSLFGVTNKFRFSEPKAGDIFIQDHGKGLGHTGFVEKVQGDKIFTIEGNTNDTGSREGYEVCRRVRDIKSCIGFIRIS